MRIDKESVNIAFLHTDNAENQAAENNSKNTARINKNANGNSIFAGGLNLGTDLVEEKRKKAREMAMDLVKDVFSKDNAYSDDLDARRQRVKELEAENAQHTEMLKDIEKEQGNLKELYGISENSTEEEELDLLRKEKAAKTDFTIKLSEEEKQKVNEINSRGLTSYQKEMLKIDDNAAEYKKKTEENEMEILQENAIVRGMKIQYLEQHDMADAVKQGEKIIKAASDEIIGMLRAEVKDNIDKQAEEEKEKAKEKKEKEEELEEQIEAARADDVDAYRRAKKEEKQREEMYEIGTSMEQIRKTGEGESVPETEKSLDQIINELILSTEDIKGLAIDKEI